MCITFQKIHLKTYRYVNNVNGNNIYKPGISIKKLEIKYEKKGFVFFY